MIFWGCILLFILVALVCYICDKNYAEISTVLSGVIAALLGICICIMLICIIVENVNVEGNIESLNQEREVLSYQLDNDVYDNDNDIGKQKLYEDITRWNANLAYAKNAQRDFWVGIFYANIYDEIDYIYLPSVESR